MRTRRYSQLRRSGVTIGLLARNAPPSYDSFFAVIVYLLDAQGNFTRLEDADLFH